MLGTDGAPEAHDSTMSGWLNKRPSQMSLKQWQQRWFIITDGQLKYFKAPDKQDLKGAIPLVGATITTGANNTIHIQHTDSDKPSRVLQADSEALQNQWATEMKRASLANASTRRVTEAAKAGSSVTTANHTKLPQQDKLQSLSLSVTVENGRDLHAICASLRDQEFWALTLLQLAIANKSREHAIAFLQQQTETCRFAHVLLGAILGQKSDKDTAIWHLKQVADSRFPTTFAALLLAEIYLKDTNYSQAQHYICMADACAESTNAEVLMLWAELLQQQGVLDTALDKVRQVLDIDPFDADAYSLLGELAVSSGDLDAAVKHFSAAAKHSPKAAWAHVNLGLILEQQGKLDQAIEQYETACSLDDGMEMAHANAAAALQERDLPGDFQSSLQHYSQLVSLCPGSIEYRSQLCHALMICGQLSKAAQHVLSLEGAFPSNPKVQFVRGKLCEQQWVQVVGSDAASHEFPHTISSIDLTHLREAESAYLLASQHPACATNTLMHLCVVQRKLGKFAEALDTLADIEQRVQQGDVRSPSRLASITQRPAAAADAAETSDFETRLKVNLRSVQLQRDLISSQQGSTDGHTQSPPHTTSQADSSHPSSAAAGDGGEAKTRSGRRESLMLSPLSVDWRPTGGSTESRTQDFFKTLRRQKQLEEEAKRRELEARVQQLPEEDRERLEAEEAAKEQHEKKQERMMRSQLKAYGSGPSSRVLVRGRGRGRGRGGGSAKR